MLTKITTIVSVLCVAIPALIVLMILVMYLIDRRDRKKKEQEAADQLEAGVMTEKGVIKSVETATATPDPIPVAIAADQSVQVVPVSEYLNPALAGKTEEQTITHNN